MTPSDCIYVGIVFKGLPTLRHKATTFYFMFHNFHLSDFTSSSIFMFILGGPFKSIKSRFHCSYNQETKYEFLLLHEKHSYPIECLPCLAISLRT
jgi:hypothetical protein